MDGNFRIECSRDELAAALKQYDTDAAANAWDKRVDEERFVDRANYLNHTIHVTRQAPKA